MDNNTTICKHVDDVDKDIKPVTPEGCEECLATGDTWVHLRDSAYLVGMSAAVIIPKTNTPQNISTPPATLSSDRLNREKIGCGVILTRFLFSQEFSKFCKLLGKPVLHTFNRCLGIWPGIVHCGFKHDFGLAIFFT
jgi:hypothetical protein